MERMSSHDEGQPFKKRIALFTAIRFLTVIPVPWHVEKDGDYFQASIYYFPVVGLLIGAGAFVLSTLSLLLFSHFVSAFFLIFYLSAISGFLHLDGLADSGDGLLSARPKEESLRIMKDSRIGAMGVVLLVFNLLGKFAALCSISPMYLPIAALLLPLAGRCAILLTMAMFRYARPEGGIGGLFYSSRAKIAAILGFSLLLLICLTLAPSGGTFATFAALFAAVAAFSSFCKKRIGGVTGDTLGAVCEISETAVAIALTVIV